MPRRVVEQVNDLYHDNPYHSFRHAVDVTHTTYRFMALTAGRKQLTPTEKFLMLARRPGLIL